jgi:transposase
MWMAWLGAIPGMSEASQWIIGCHVERLDGLREEIKRVEQRLSEWSKEDPVVEKLLELPGVGPVTAWVLRAEIGLFDRFRSGKQLSRFCGLSPRNASSGARQADAGLIKAGNPLLRATVIEAAHRLIRNCPRWGALAYKMERAGKPRSVIAAAVGNRWIRWLYYQMNPKKTNNDINHNIKR